IHYEFAASSFAWRVDKYTHRALPGIDLDQAITALRPVENDLLKEVVQHANVITTRQASQNPYVDPDKMAALQEAVKLFSRRGQGPDTSSEATDTSFARQFLVPEDVLKDFA